MSLPSQAAPAESLPFSAPFPFPVELIETGGRFGPLGVIGEVDLASNITEVAGQSTGQGLGNDPITGSFITYVKDLCPECHAGKCTDTRKSLSQIDRHMFILLNNLCKWLKAICTDLLINLKRETF